MKVFVSSLKLFAQQIDTGRGPRLALADDGPRPGRGVPSLRHLNASGLNMERWLWRARLSSLRSDSAGLAVAQVGFQRRQRPVQSPSKKHFCLANWFDKSLLKAPPQFSWCCRKVINRSCMLMSLFQMRFWRSGLTRGNRSNNNLATIDLGRNSPHDS